MVRPRGEFAEHHVQTTRSARYYTLGNPLADLEDIWIVCHGYSQLAAKFIQYFGALDNGRTLVVAPEALSLFYLNRFAASRGDARKVGASWMTRENRTSEIDDYVRYLDRIHDDIFDRVNRGAVRLTAMGFSQGAATVSRWWQATANQIDRLVLWGGRLPPDMDLGAAAPRLRQTELHLVVGRRDELVGEAEVNAEEKRLAQYGIAYRLTLFDGGHHMSLRTLRELAGSVGR